MQPILLMLAIPNRTPYTVERLRHRCPQACQAVPKSLRRCMRGKLGLRVHFVVVLLPGKFDHSTEDKLKEPANPPQRFLCRVEALFCQRQRPHGGLPHGCHRRVMDQYSIYIPTGIPIHIPFVNHLPIRTFKFLVHSVPFLQKHDLHHP